MTEPTQSCVLCGRVIVVRPGGRGFPPDVAKRELQRRCDAAGCRCEPHYLAGMSGGLATMRGKLAGQGQ